MLSDGEAIAYTNCSKEVVGDIASWDNEQDWEIVGQKQNVNLDLNQICSLYGSMEEKIMIMPARLAYAGMY